MVVDEAAREGATASTCGTRKWKCSEVTRPKEERERAGRLLGSGKVRGDGAEPVVSNGSTAATSGHKAATHALGGQHGWTHALMFHLPPTAAEAGHVLVRNSSADACVCSVGGRERNLTASTTVKRD